jgi:tetratricopeptide (TPR) repeat protein
MCGALETLRSKAEKAREDRDSEGALTAWEDLRTLARVVHGPSDIRVWASLSRVARALLERGGDRADAAASLAAGAVRLMTEAAEAALPAPEALPVSVASPGQDALPAAGDSSGQDASAASDSSPGQEAFPAAGDLPGQDASTAADAAHGPEDSNGSDASSISEAAFGSGASDALPAPEGSNACDAVSGSEDSDFPDTAFYQEEPPGPDDDSGREESACPAYVAVPGPEMAFAYQTLSMALDQLRASPPEWRQDSETSADSGISPAAQPPSSVASGTEPSVNGTSGAVPSVNGTSGAVPSVNGTSAAEPSVTVSCGDGGPAPAFTLAEALWPVPVSEDEPARYPFEWAQNDPALMRSRFADTARIHGARSQQAQVARSILGEALAVAGKPEHAAEARELLKTSSDELGHSRLSGSADVPDSMARYARLLSGCLGPAPLLFPRTGLPSSINELRRSAELYREIQHTLASGPFMTRRRLAATLGEARALTALGRHREAADILRLKNSNPPDAVAGTRVRLSLMFDTAETYLTDWEFDPETAWGWHARCAFGRLERLGARHRDTAASMARLADVAAWCEAPTVKAAALRARAAEILGRLGGPDALLVPDLTARIAWDLMKLDEHATAAELLARAIPGLAPSGSDRFPQVPEALVMAGQACFRAGDREGARAAFSRAGYLLDGNHSRSPVPEKYRKELYAEVQLGLAKIEVEGHPSADAECAGASGEPVPAEASGASWPAGPAEARGNSWRPGAYEASGAQGLPEPDESGTFAAPEPPPPPAFPARPAFPEIPPAVTAEDSALEKPLSFHLMDSSSRGNWEAISRAAAEDAARKKAREAAGIPMRPRRPKKRFSTRPSGRA